MYVKKRELEVITIEEAIIVYGLNLQGSGLPISFDSLGMMWDRYTEDIKRSTPNLKDGNIEYGVCLNKVPDYIVGLEVTEINEEPAGYKCFTIPAGQYVKVLFNGENHANLVDQKLMSNQKAAKKWAKSEKLKLNNKFTVEVYPKHMAEMEYPEMYCLFPID